MIELRTKLKVRRDSGPIERRGQIKLPFDLRQKSRLRTKLVSGEEVALLLPRGEVLRGGDLLVASDGGVIEVLAERERVLHITCDTPQALAKAAYHLGNRHVPVEVGDGFLRIGADHVLEEMLRGLGATIKAMEVPFEPEAGAYGGGHHHYEEGSQGGRIHHYGDGHDHPHDHDHGHDHDHRHHK